MQQLQRIRERKPFGRGPEAVPVQSSIETVDGHPCPVQKRNGIEYALIPRILLQNLKTGREFWQWAFGGTTLALVFLISYAITKGPTVVERPIVVEKDRVETVNTNCLLWCGK